jgi:hypothetical protein
MEQTNTPLSFENIKRQLENLPDEEVPSIDSLPDNPIVINHEDAVPVECLTTVTPDTFVSLSKEEIENLELRKDETEYDTLKRKSIYAKIIALYDIGEAVYCDPKHIEGTKKLLYTEKVYELFNNLEIDEMETRFNTIMRCVLVDGDVSKLPCPF